MDRNLGCDFAIGGDFNVTKHKIMQMLQHLKICVPQTG